MRRTFLPATLIVLVVITPALIRGQKDEKDKGIVGVMPAQVRWFTPPYPADTIVEVSSLALPGLEIEIEAIAVAR